MTEYQMAQYERQMSQAGYSVFYQDQKRIFDNNEGHRQVWERVNSKWAKISG